MLYEAILCKTLPGHKVELVYGNDSRLFEKGKEGALTVKMQSMDMFAADRTVIQEKTTRYFASQVMADGWYMKIYKRVLEEIR